MTYRIKGWVKFQHFKDRRPPWIKLYRDILEDPDWHDLDGDTAKILVALWLLASEDEDQEGKLPDSRRLAFRLRVSETKVNQALAKLSHWLEQDDIDVISTGYQVDAPETETETETKKKATSVALPEGVSDSVWQEFKSLRKAKKAPITQRAVDALTKEANKAGWTLEKALEECVIRGWQAFKADWIATKTNPADNIRTTVPPSTEPDPALTKIIEDAKKASPMPDHIRQAMAQLRNK